MTTSGRLRVLSENIYSEGWYTQAELVSKSADEIDKLRKALETIAKYHDDEVDSACAKIASDALK